VLLELSHELDALCFALDCTATSVTHCDLRFDGAPTDGKVETVAEVELVTSAGIAGSVHLDMVADEPVRDWVIFGTEGTLRVDALRSTIRNEKPDGTAHTIAEFARGERDRAERRLIEHLLELSNPEIHPRCTTEDGILALAIIDAARKSYMSGQVAPVEQHVRQDQ
jgi:predicted dehydrogenase